MIKRNSFGPKYVTVLVNNTHVVHDDDNNNHNYNLALVLFSFQELYSIVSFAFLTSVTLWTIKSAVS
jgi:hypothetical protein